MILPDKEMLLSAFDYDPNTGVLIFKKRTPDMFKKKETLNTNAIFLTQHLKVRLRVQNLSRVIFPFGLTAKSIKLIGLSGRL